MSAEEKHDVLVEERFLVVLLVHGRCSNWRAKGPLSSIVTVNKLRKIFIDTGG
jgi:hypothetical protein